MRSLVKGGNDPARWGGTGSRAGRSLGAPATRLLIAGVRLLRPAPAIPKRVVVPILTVANKIQLAALWFLASFALFLVGNWSHAVWDRDEPRYCVATAEMIRYGDWVVPTFNRELRYDKPILIYWLMAPSLVAFGENEFAARFPSALFGGGRVAILFLLALAMGCSLRGAHLAALAGATTVLLQALSKAATTDSVLIFTVVAAMALFWWSQVSGFRWWRHLAFYAMIGLAVLVKGPPGPAFVALGILMYWGWMHFRPSRDEAFGIEVLPLSQTRCPAGPRFPGMVTLSGLLVFFAVTLPWAIMVTLRTQGDFLQESIGRHVVERAREPLEGHSGPFFYYLPILPLAVLPLTPLVILAAIWGWRNCRLPQVRFLASWLLPGLIVISAVSTKLPHYTAPLLPSLCLLLGLWYTRRQTAGAVTPDFPRTRRTLAVLMAVIGLAVAVALPVAVLLVGFPLGLLPFLVTGLLVFAAMGGGAWLLWKGLEWESSWAWGAGLSVALMVGVLWPLSLLEPIRPSKTIALWMRENLPEDTRLLSARYQEPSMYFYWGEPVTEVRASEWEEGFAVLTDRSRRTAFVTLDTHWERWSEEYRNAHGGDFPQDLEIIHEQRFYQFEAGRWITLVVIRNWHDS